MELYNFKKNTANKYVYYDVNYLSYKHLGR